MRRNWVALDDRMLLRCVLLDGKHNVRSGFGAFELTSARGLTAYDLRGPALRYGPLPERLEPGIRTYRALDVACCYAFHCKAIDSVKLGRTTKLFRRWAKLETEGGRPVGTEPKTLWGIVATATQTVAFLFPADGSS